MANARVPRFGELGVCAVLLLTPGCIVPTVSLHSTRDVAISITEAETGKQSGRMPIRVRYWSETLTPLYWHIELREPEGVQSETDENGRVVLPLADYAWETRLHYGTNASGKNLATFYLSKKLIREGGVCDESPLPGLKRPKLRATLTPLNE